MIKRLTHILINRIYFFFLNRNDPNPFLGAIVITILLLFINTISIFIIVLFFFDKPFKVSTNIGIVVLIITGLFFYLMIKKVKNEIINLNIKNKNNTNFFVIFFLILTLIFFAFSMQKSGELRFSQRKLKNTQIEDKGSFEEDFRKWWRGK
jgi:magnesium-transporting ATPase (P-type)